VATLLLIIGVLNTLPEFRQDHALHAHPMLVFGFFYFLAGLALVMNYRFGPLLGIIFPLIGLGAAFLVIGVLNWTTMLAILFAIEAIVVVCCFVLFFRGTR